MSRVDGSDWDEVLGLRCMILEGWRKWDFWPETCVV